MRDYRLSGQNPKHHTGDYRVGLTIPTMSNFRLVNLHSENIKEFRSTQHNTMVCGGIKNIPGGIQTEIKCEDRKIIIKTFKDGSKQVTEVE